MDVHPTLPWVVSLDEVPLAATTTLLLLCPLHAFSRNSTLQEELTNAPTSLLQSAVVTIWDYVGRRTVLSFDVQVCAPRCHGPLSHPESLAGILN